MSFNGSGTFVINTAGQPVVANTVISATVFNALTADLATGLSTCITKDGQTTITANIPFGSNKITGLGAATAATDAATFGQVQSTAAKLITVTGTDTITGTMSPALTAYAAGQLFYFIANAANTGAMTINIDGLGAKAITRDGSTALIAGDVNTGEIVVICYDGTRFQMINAANSFGNTTINGTLTVTGNTGLQANVSITSTLSVGGTFAVTGAATLGSTLSVTGKSDLPVVSTASMNAAVAVITTGTVTNLTSTSASIASMNAGVALLTNATVTTLTATGASIASANIGNLQFTAASIASINAGVAVITNLTATSASIASMNAGVALLTTATVTNLTATGASIASANAGNLQATGASVASANVGVALITTGTVTALTATGASIASANVGTAVVTGLTVTNASIASANAGTATLSGNLTLNGGTANGVLYLNGSKVATSGAGLVFDGTNLGIGVSPSYRLDILASGSAAGLRINNASAGKSAMLLQTNGTTAGIIALTGFIQGDSTTNFGFFAETGNDIRLYTNGSPTPKAVLDTSGNLGIGTSSPGAKVHSKSANNQYYAEDSATGNLFAVQNASNAVRLNAYTSANAALPIIFSHYITDVMTISASGNLGLGVTPSAWSLGKAIQIGTDGAASLLGYDNNAYLTANAYYNSAWKYAASSKGSTMYQQIDGQHQWLTAVSGTAGNTISFTQAMTLDSGGRLLLGRITSDANNYRIQISQGTATYGSGIQFVYEGAGAAAIWENSSGALCFGNDGADGDTERARITSGGLFQVTADGANNTFTDSGQIALKNSGGSPWISWHGSTGSRIGYLQMSDSGAASLWVQGNQPLAFATNNTERARITSGGDFLVGTTSSAASSSDGVKILPGGFVYSVGPSATADTYNYYNSTAGAFRFYVTNGGTIFATNTTISAISDQRLKENIRDLDAGLDAVMALKPRKFDWKEGKGQDKKDVRGFIAQEFEQVFPDLIDTWKDPAPEGEEPYKSVRQDLIPVLVKAIQELKAELDAAKVKIAALEAK